ncbi:translation elongation factor [Vibrio ishigakensis]|uniref:Translation elongation factor n=1 Tax=Vibrio ishigakensis TaxID=1481914 RepID=A0A0B8NL31_9VIBR|nr:translation elongation factor [Vibrio ishigakensis]
MSEPLWKPSADISALRLRAKVVNRIRQFFAERDVLEVDTPALSMLR